MITIMPLAEENRSKQEDEAKTPEGQFNITQVSRTNISQ